MNQALRTRLPAAERERQILRAAIRVFARSNYRLAGTADIAAEAGVAEPTIYRYFTSKKALFLRILAYVGQRILEIWRHVVEGEGDALSALHKMADVYSQNVRTHPNELKIQFQALAEVDDPDIAAQLRANHAAYVQFFADLIQRGQRQGTIRSDVDPHTVAWHLDSIGFSLTLLRLLGFERDAPDQRFADMIDQYIRWLAVG